MKRRPLELPVHPLPYVLRGSVWLDSHTSWLDNPWTHVALICAALGLVWLLFWSGAFSQS